MASSPEVLARFRAFIQQILRKHFNNDPRLLAGAIGMGERNVRRSFSKHSQYTYSLEHCLLLAQALHGQVSAMTIFQKADKADSVRMMQQLFGRPKLTAYDEALLEASSQLTPAQQEQVLQFARFLREHESPSLPPKPKSRQP